MNKKINVIFLINELFINNFEYVYKKMIKSSDFNVTVVACESNATDYKDFVSSRQIYEFLKSKKINCIDSYNPKTKKILGVLTSEDLLLIALIFLFMIFVLLQSIIFI